MSQLEPNSDQLLPCCAYTDEWRKKISEARTGYRAPGYHAYRDNPRVARIYESMKSRCNNPNRKKYESYGARGIYVCDEWNNSFESFCEWALANGYEDGLQLDRIDNSGPYSPDNCRWVTLKQQANNRRSNVRVDYDGKSMALSELADYSMLPKNTVKLRYEHGWSLDDIVKTPYKARRKWSETNGYAE